MTNGVEDGFGTGKKGEFGVERNPLHIPLKKELKMSGVVENYGKYNLKTDRNCPINYTINDLL